MRRILECVLAVSFQFILQAELAHAEGYATVFYYNKNSLPVTRLDHFPELKPELKAILALYALENGAGCEDKDESGLKCDMTTKLGLGSNCSHEHIQFVRSWFDDTPNLSSRWNKRWNAKAKSPGTLEELCYGQPDTASWQNIWESIKIKTTGELVKVEAILYWRSRYGQGRVRYKNTYKSNSHTIIETSSERRVLSESSEGQ